jgi:hypothetical protein
MSSTLVLLNVVVLLTEGSREVSDEVVQEGSTVIEQVLLLSTHFSGVRVPGCRLRRTNSLLLTSARVTHVTGNQEFPFGTDGGGSSQPPSRCREREPSTGPLHQLRNN